MNYFSLYKSEKCAKASDFIENCIRVSNILVTIFILI